MCGKGGRESIEGKKRGKNGQKEYGVAFVDDEEGRKSGGWTLQEADRARSKSSWD